MRATRILLPLLAVTGALAACLTRAARLEYPVAARDEVADEYHGTRVADPYRWLEAPDAPETRAWIEAENALTDGYLQRIPERERIRARMTELWDYERYEIPVHEGGRIFYRKNDGLQSQSALYVAESLTGEPRLLVDPDALSADGTVALMSFVPSPDGELVALGLSDGGSDWRTWKVLDVDTGRERADVITRNKFGGLAWAADASGFFYARYDVPAPGSELQARNPPPDVCFHRLGTSEADDFLIARRPAEPGRTQSFSLSDDGTVLYLAVRDVASRANDLARVRLEPWGGGWRASGEREALVEGFEARVSPVGEDAARVLVKSDLGAPRGRIVAIEAGASDPASWTPLVPESEHALQSADVVGDVLVASYLVDARSEVRLFALDGSPLGTVELPGLGTVGGFGGDRDDRLAFYSFESFTQPAAIHAFDLVTMKSSPFRASPLRFDPGDYETTQVFYTSRDGTRVPMFVTARRGTRLDGENRTYLYGYGGFGVALTPTFSVPHLVWLEMGGVLAIPNLRGGGEYGEEWHEAGTKLAKQNVFDDFLAAAEWLTANGWTDRARLAIGGRSNGGLLVGACLTQRPDLFGAALPAVGVLDMLRYHRFTIGWAWAGDYGTADDPEQFRGLLAYSPLHNVRAGTAYPPTLVTTADHDDRVVPAHSYKFTAALQAAQAGPAPILIRVDTRAGHGAGKPTAMRIEEEADRWAFLVHELAN